MSDPVTEIKSESRIIQQKIYQLEQKVTAMEARHEALNKILEVEAKINRIESLLNDKLTRLTSCTDNTLTHVEKLKDEVDAIKQVVCKPGQEPSF